MIFRHFWVIFLIPIAVFLIIYLNRRDKAASFRFPDYGLVKEIAPSLKLQLSSKIKYVRYIAIALFFLALARPSVVLEESWVNREGIDIVLAIDCSGSMQAEDFTIGRKRKNRLEVVKLVVKDFIKERDGDRIGIVAFAGRAYTVCPLTLDYDWLLSNLDRVHIGLIEDGTAIGSSIASSLNRLRHTLAKSKIVILLSDGVNNAGKVDPLAASEAAKALGIKIYAVGVGTRGWVPFPAKDFWGRDVYQKVKIELDEVLLSQIASNTGAQYFLATNTNTLRDIYKEIDKMEKTEVQELGYKRYRELFHLFLIPALILLVGETLLKNTLLRKIP